MPVDVSTSDKKSGVVYVTYSAFKTGIRGLQDNGKLPSHVDPSLLGSMSGSTKAEFMSALRKFELIGKNGAPTDRLHLMATQGDPEWKGYMKTLVEQYYSDKLPILADGTPKKLIESFETVTGTVREKAIRFLLLAAEDAGVPVSKAVREGKYTTTSTKTPKTQPSPSQAGDRTETNEADQTSMPDGMVSYPIHLRGKPPGKIIVPQSLTLADIKIIEGTVALIKLYADTESDNA